MTPSRENASLRKSPQRNRRLLLERLELRACLSVGAGPNAPIGAGYSRTFLDDFESISYNTQSGSDTSYIWDSPVGNRAQGINSVDTVVPDTEKGELSLTNYSEGNKHHAEVLSSYGPNGFSFEYGYAEARIKMNNLAGGLLQGFWLMQESVDGVVGDSNTSGVEIDILESSSQREKPGSPGSFEDLTHTMHHNAFWNGYDYVASEWRSGNLKFGTKDFALADYHTYGVKWEPSGYTFYVDGVQTATFNQAVSHRKQYLKLSTEVLYNPDIVGSIPTNGYGAKGNANNPKMTVDYVAVWQRTPPIYVSSTAQSVENQLIPDQELAVNQSLTLPVRINDASDLNFKSSNPSLLTINPATQFTTTSATTGTLTLTPATNQSGVATITVTDAAGTMELATFVVRVNALKPGTGVSTSLNGSFENGITGWQKTGGGNVFTNTEKHRSSYNVRSENNSYQLKNSTDSSGNIVGGSESLIMSAPISLTKDQVYSLSAWGKAFATKVDGNGMDIQNSNPSSRTDNPATTTVDESIKGIEFGVIYTTSSAGTNPKFSIFSDHFIAGSTTFTPAANTTARIYAKLPKNSYIPNYAYYAWVDDFVLVTGAGPKIVDTADGNDNSILNITLPESSLTVPETNTIITTLQSTNATNCPVTYSIIGGTDANYPTSTTNGIYQSVFWLDETTGVLKFADPPDFEKPVDRARTNIYSLLVQARDANGLVNKATINIKVTDVPISKEPPVITSYDGRSYEQADEIRIFIPENRADVTTVTATSHAGGLNYSLGGPDASLFNIDNSTGKLNFLAPPDFETPKDADKDNEYIVSITAADDSKLSDKQTLKVVVTNVKFTSLLSLKAGDIVLSDTDSINNIYTLSHNAGKYIITDTSSNPDAGVDVIGVTGATIDPLNYKRVTIADSAFSSGLVSLIINANAGDDIVYIDTQSNESPVPTKGLSIDLGAGKDNLFLVNTATTNTWTINGPQSGSVSLGTLGTVAFQGMEIAAGGSGADTFILTNTGTNGVLTLNGHTGTNSLQVARNADFTLRNATLTIGGLSTAQTFTLANIQQATINGGVEDNYINASAYTGKATINGGDGNDVILGGTGEDILNGGNGNDWLSGGAGNDILYGMSGRDILVGGDGSDKLNTANTATSVGDDLLIGGKTIYDTNKAAIDAILASWVSSLTYANHIKALTTTGVGSTKQYKLNSTSVLNDNASDSLFGGGGTDWFFAITAGANKDTQDATGSEQVS